MYDNDAKYYQRRVKYYVNVLFIPFIHKYFSRWCNEILNESYGIRSATLCASFSLSAKDNKPSQKNR